MLLKLASALFLPFLVPSHAMACPPPASVSVQRVPGHPFSAVSSSDECWIFVSLNISRGQSAVAVLHNRDGAFSLRRVFTLDGGAYGAVLSPDGKSLYVAGGNTTAVLSVAALERNGADALTGRLRDGHGAGAVYVATSRDGRFLFVSDERRKRISVFDLARARATHFQDGARVGYIPVGVAPVGLALSPDGQWLYSTSERAPAGSRLARSCMTRHRRHVPGFLARIKVSLAETHPERSIDGVVRAGCNPVRVAVSGSAQWLWVTARGDGELLRIPANAFAASGSRTKTTVYKIGGQPVGVVVRPDGRQVWVALSMRFGTTKYEPTRRQLIGLAGMNSAGQGPTKLLRAPASGFPREVSFLPDGRTLVVTLYAARRIEFVPTPKLLKP